MPCARFEDLLLDYEELPAYAREPVDAHLAACPACREYLETLSEIDLRLTSLYAGAQASSALGSAVRSRVRNQTRLPRPSALPEVLDFIGGSAVVAVLAWLALVLLPRPALAQLPRELLTFAITGGAAVAFIAAVWAGLRSHAEPE
jgi:anti-sigma factor RsiW